MACDRYFFFCLPKSPLSRASASGGFLSFRSESSWGLDNSICWSKAGSSSPWGEEPWKVTGVEGCGARCAAGCCGLTAACWLVEEEVPGTVMERKSIWGRPRGDRIQGGSWHINGNINFYLLTIDNISTICLFSIITFCTWMNNIDFYSQHCIMFSSCILHLFPHTLNWTSILFEW